MEREDPRTAVLMMFPRFEHVILNERHVVELNQEQALCSVCHAGYHDGSILTRVGCQGNHFYHYTCILTALQNSNHRLIKAYSVHFAGKKSLLIRFREMT